jgi:hypothetical protein
MALLYQIIELSDHRDQCDADGKGAPEDLPGPSTRSAKPQTASTTFSRAVSQGVFRTRGLLVVHGDEWRPHALRHRGNLDCDADPSGQNQIT